MKPTFIVALLLVLLSMLTAQSNIVVIPAQSFDPTRIQPVLDSISRRAKSLEPMLDQLKADDWTAKGAPPAYAEQWKTEVALNRAVENDMATLAANPADVTGALKIVFRFDSFTHALPSLLAGARRYENAPLADLIQSVSAEGESDAVELRQFVIDLSAERDRQWDLMDKEAQRCRASLAAAPAVCPAPSRGGRAPSATTKASGPKP